MNHHALYRPGQRSEIARFLLYFRWLYRHRRRTGEEPTTEQKRARL